MELDAMQRARDDDEEYYNDDSNEEADDTLFFMEVDHDKIRSQEDPKTQDYWEAGITTDTISALNKGTWIIPKRPATTVTAKGTLKQIAQPGKDWKPNLGLRDWDPAKRGQQHVRDTEPEEDEENPSLAG